VTFLAAFALMAAKMPRRWLHGICLTLGAIGLLSVGFIHGEAQRGLLLAAMALGGVAWASILSMPYAILSGALPPERMGVYVGIFNFFIVLPQIITALTFGPLVKHVLGGNLAVKLAGELDASSDLPVAGVVAISPTIDLDLCVRAIERRANFVYQFNFVRNLKARMRRMAAAWPGRYDLRPLRSIWTIRQFDEMYTAPSHGFQGASDYYHRASALRVVDRIRVPALILTAEDDPFVPVSQFRDPALRVNPHIAVCIERKGGHCGFAANAAGDDGYWAETTAIDFLASIMPR
jgi:MFS family permease